MLADYQRKLGDVVTEVDNITALATTEAKTLAAETRQSLKEYFDRRIKLAEEKIARAQMEAVRELRNDVVDAAIAAAQNLIAAKLARSGQKARLHKHQGAQVQAELTTARAPRVVECAPSSKVEAANQGGCESPQPPKCPQLRRFKATEPTQEHPILSRVGSETRWQVIPPQQLCTSLLASAYYADRSPAFTHGAGLLSAQRRSPEEGLVGAEAGNFVSPSRITRSRPSLLYRGCHCTKKGAGPKPTPLLHNVRKRRWAYGFFSAQALVAASHAASLHAIGLGLCGGGPREGWAGEGKCEGQSKYRNESFMTFLPYAGN